MQGLNLADEALNNLMEKAMEIGQQQAESQGENQVGSFGPGLEGISVRRWQDAKDSADQEEEDGKPSTPATVLFSSGILLNWCGPRSPESMVIADLDL